MYPAFTSFPIEIFPLIAGISPKIVLINVVFPVPFLPWIFILVPKGISMLTGGVEKFSYPHTNSDV